MTVLDADCWRALMARNAAGASTGRALEDQDESPEDVRSGCNPEPFNPPSQAEAIENVRATGVRQARADATQPEVSSRAAEDAASSARLAVYCTATNDSLLWLVRGILSRLNEVPAEMRRSDVNSAQTKYDVARWATEDLNDHVGEFTRLCGVTAPSPVSDVQTAASQVRTAWSAIRDWCQTEFALHGLDCG